ncbi:GNAT family N-acetyltransferase [Phreatobacter stygius]|uniref:GNAT family N-acetyltransferase n=1 Tax=Phreatobacter stygius TaxID=1940610 RepID=A0A4D7BEJ0_9HYPH|nr:GNAT family N-acetyltransferase [Phreatobacter stygius]QCI68863.1 GNAT family N-acetyltransferase [Phreatobacter stygius]
MPVDVRAATEADLDRLVELNQVVQGLHAALYPGDFKPTADPVEMRTFFAARLDGPHSAIGIAETDGIPVGYVLFDVQVRPETPLTPPRARLYVQHIAVAAAARRRGVAAALMRYVEGRALFEGIDEIALDIWSANLDAQHFFAAQGFAAFNVTLRKTLAEPR